MRTEIVKVGKYSFTIKIDPNMPDYSKDPFFVKKFEEFDAFMKKHPGLARENKTNSK